MLSQNALTALSALKYVLSTDFQTFDITENNISPNGKWEREELIELLSEIIITEQEEQ